MPEDYRAFLIEIGNGGDGPPGYGLRPITRTYPAPCSRTGERDLAYTLDKLARPFPLDDYWIWEGEADFDEQRYATTHHGNLPIGNNGCSWEWLLIVTGNQRGAIWNRADVGIQPCCPRRGFLSWYEYWLDGGDDWWADYYKEVHAHL